MLQVKQYKGLMNSIDAAAYLEVCQAQFQIFVSEDGLPHYKTAEGELQFHIMDLIRWSETKRSMAEFDAMMNEYDALTKNNVQKYIDERGNRIVVTNGEMTYCGKLHDSVGFPNMRINRKSK